MNIHICHIYISRVCHTEPETTDYPIYSSWVNVCYYFLVDSNVMLALATDTLYTALPGTNIILPPNRLCYSSRIPYSHFPFPRKNPHTISNPNSESQSRAFGFRAGRTRWTKCVFLLFGYFLNVSCLSVEFTIQKLGSAFPQPKEAPPKMKNSCL